jgi:chaperone BCS1
VTADTKIVLDKLLFAAHEKSPSIMVCHYKADEKRWHKNRKVYHRDESTLFIKREDKDNLMSDINDFVADEKEYEHHGIPYKRNYLFYGDPGTGKTSLVNIIANKIKRNINIISFDSELTDSGLYNAVNEIDGAKTILLLEDVDCIFSDRNINANNSRVSFSALLNILDGVASSKGLITIITTNYVKKLDKALLRPGRTDVMIEFTLISREQIEELLTFYKVVLDHKTVAELVKLSLRHKLTPSVFSGFMFRNRKSGLNDMNYLTLFKKYLTEIDVSLANDNHQSMFS